MREHYESAFVSKKDLLQVQDCQAPRSGAGNLREPQAQATAGMIRAGAARLDASGVAPMVDETGGLKWQE
jgi:hypothetical protein